MRDAAARVTLGVSLRTAAKLAGVNRGTIAMYEIDPGAVRDEEKREAIAKVYRLLRGVLAEAPSPLAATG